MVGDGETTAELEVVVGFTDDLPSEVTRGANRLGGQLPPTRGFTHPG